MVMEQPDRISDLRSVTGLPASAMDPIRQLLKEEMLVLQQWCQGSRMDAMLLSCTEVALKDDSDPAFRRKVLEAYEYTKVLKERAGIAVRLLITEHKLPHEVYHNDYDLEKMTKSQHVWAARLTDLECLLYSSMLPGNDISGFWEDHID
jgi:hypothetical protein